jgi:hypothetical protein
LGGSPTANVPEGLMWVFILLTVASLMSGLSKLCLLQPGYCKVSIKLITKFTLLFLLQPFFSRTLRVQFYHFLISLCFFNDSLLWHSFSNFIMHKNHVKRVFKVQISFSYLWPPPSNSDLVKSWKKTRICF